ncbi:hypothetical protein QAD02_005508 [Eretmocerus hayati]|uniref:Uncharacterized protein n=1 Tax=Eretmocerus hayati TaxID=131215 RepID=A0ACC2NUF4_9HYME|nr:hypothetical protein QAD02_005508 [Eretmocerus hayati]
MEHIVRFVYLVSIVLLITLLTEIFGHGMLMDPVSRSSAWRKGFENPINVDDNALYCGGVHQDRERRENFTCGVCGDDHNLPQPRPNEYGGEFGNGTIVKTYKVGERIEVSVNVTACHRGTFEFSLCPLDGSKDIETEDCFRKFPLKGKMITPHNDTEETYFFGPADVNGDYTIELQLPANFTCQHCSFRWEWIVGNNVGYCLNGTEALGCGTQETFRNCADISIE